MSENKITQQELEVIQGLVKEMRETEGNFFKASLQAEELAIAKAQLVKALQDKNQELQAEMDKVKAAYGDIVVNLEDGSYKPAPAQEAEVVAPQ
jgi:hypothetical protein